MKRRFRLFRNMRPPHPRILAPKKKARRIFSRINLSHKKILIPAFFFILLMLMFAWGIFFSGLFRIRQLKIEGLESIGEDEIWVTIREELDESRAVFFPPNLFFFDVKSVEEALTKRYPRIAQVTIVRVLPDTLRIVIEERKVVAIWCGTHDCFYLDKTGTLFEKAPQARGALVLLIEDVGEGEAAFGSVVLPAELIHYMVEVKNILAEAKIHILRFRTGSPGKLEAVTDEGWILFLDPHERVSPSRLAGILRNALNANPLKDLRSRLEYVDARTPGRIYYK